MLKKHFTQEIKRYVRWTENVRYFDYLIIARPFFLFLGHVSEIY